MLQFSGLSFSLWDCMSIPSPYMDMGEGDAFMFVNIPLLYAPPPPSPPGVISGSFCAVHLIVYRLIELSGRTKDNFTQRLWSLPTILIGRWRGFKVVRGKLDPADFTKHNIKLWKMLVYKHIWKPYIVYTVYQGTAKCTYPNSDNVDN